MRPQISQPVRNSAFFPFLLVVFIALASVSSFLVPLGEAPDEVSHYSYADYVSRHLALPPAEGAAYGQVHQPPLYYALVASAIRLIPRAELEIRANPDFVLFDPQTPNLLLHPRDESFPYQGNALAWHLARLLSVVMSAVTVWAVWQLARELVSDAWLALGSAAFVAFLPEFVFVGSVVNNDNLVIMLSALSVLQTVRVIKPNARLRDFLWLGILIGLAPLAKLSGLVACLFAAVVLGWQLFRLPSRRSLLLGAAVAGIAAALVYLPFALYNLARYGDPLGWSFLLADSTLRTNPMTFADFSNNVRNLYLSFWARYGGAMHLDLPGWTYVAFTLLALTAVVGFILAWRKPGAFAVPSSQLKRLAVLVGLFWLLLLIAHTRWSLNTLGSDQARQLFAGLPLLAIFLTTGWARLFKNTRTAALLWGACFFAAALFMLFTLFSTYRAPVYAASKPLPTSDSTPVDFGKTIRLLDYSVEPLQVHPGDTVTFTAYWQALKPIDQNDWLLLQLMRGSEAIVNKDGVPTAGRLTTDLWQTNVTYTSHHTFQIPADAGAGKYTLTLGLHPSGTYDWLRVKNRDIYPLGTITIVQ